MVTKSLSSRKWEIFFFVFVSNYYLGSFIFVEKNNRRSEVIRTGSMKEYLSSTFKYMYLYSHSYMDWYLFIALRCSFRPIERVITVSGCRGPSAETKFTICSLEPILVLRLTQYFVLKWASQSHISHFKMYNELVK